MKPGRRETLEEKGDGGPPAPAGTTKGRRILLWVEWSVIYILVPLAAFFELAPFSKLWVVAPAVLYAVIVFMMSPRSGPPGPAQRRHPWRWLFLRAVVFIPLLLLLAWIVNPAWLFRFPRTNPALWMAVMVLYPFLSALPQEFLYRRFYFSRYAPLFQSEAGRILSSSLVFAFLHIIYDNSVAPILSLAGGLLFSLSYSRTGRLVYPWVEHTLYGQMIFTVGLGRYFYEPLVK